MAQSLLSLASEAAAKRINECDKTTDMDWLIEKAPHLLQSKIARKLDAKKMNEYIERQNGIWNVKKEFNTTCFQYFLMHFLQVLGSTFQRNSFMRDELTRKLNDFQYNFLFSKKTPEMINENDYLLFSMGLISFFPYVRTGIECWEKRYFHARFSWLNWETRFAVSSIHSNIKRSIPLRHEFKRSHKPKGTSYEKNLQIPSDPKENFFFYLSSLFASLRQARYHEVVSMAIFILTENKFKAEPIIRHELLKVWGALAVGLNRFAVPIEIVFSCLKNMEKCSHPNCLTDEIECNHFHQIVRMENNNYREEAKLFNWVLKNVAKVSDFFHHSLYIHFCSQRKLIEELLSKALIFKNSNEKEKTKYLYLAIDVIRHITGEIRNYLLSYNVHHRCKTEMNTLMNVLSVHRAACVSMMGVRSNVDALFSLKSLAKSMKQIDHHISILLQIFDGEEEAYENKMTEKMEKMQRECRMVEYNSIKDIYFTHYILLQTLTNKHEKLAIKMLDKSMKLFRALPENEIRCNYLDQFHRISENKKVDNFWTEKRRGEFDLHSNYPEMSVYQLLKCNKMVGEIILFGSESSASNDLKSQ